MTVRLQEDSPGVPGASWSHGVRLAKTRSPGRLVAPPPSASVGPPGDQCCHT